MTILGCGWILGLTRDQTYRRARHLSISIQKNISRKCANHSVDANKFIHCDLPETAYCLGLIWADGHIRNTPIDNAYSISLECVEPDIDVFYNIFSKIGNWRLNRRQRQNRKATGIISTSNKELVNYLTDNDYKFKSKSACKILSTIPTHLHRYFLLGLIDGDGCFSISLCKNKQFNRHFTIGSEYNQDWIFVENIFKELNITYGIHGSQKAGERNSVIYVSNYAGFITLKKYLYLGCSVPHLERKEVKLNEIIKSYKD